MLYRYQLVKGDSFDLRTGFDLSDPRVQESVIQRIEQTPAALVILSNKFSTLQELNIAVHGPEWEEAFKIEKLKAAKHIEFSMDIAK